jgi:Mrp family chromosome partitioning ATPase/capsular polysaccharide biosynthesis protein
MEPLRRRWWIVALVALAISALVYLHYRGSAPTYTASTTVYVQPSSLDSTLVGGIGFADAERTVKNQARLLQTPAVANEVARELDYEGDPRGLLSLVTATPAEDSDFVQIDATAFDPKFAADIANGFADGFVRLGRRRVGNDAERARERIEDELSQLEPTTDNRTVRRDLQQRLATIALVEAVPTQAARQVDHAVPPPQASAPAPLQNAIFAGLLGLMLGVVLVYGLEALDRRMAPSSVEAEYGMPVLASIPMDRNAGAKVRGRSLPASMVEPVRTVRTTLDQEVKGRPAPRTILVMSAIPGEGKSTLTKGLALGFHASGRNVLVIDADLRHPVLDDWFRLPREPGLSDILRTETSFEHALQEVSLDGGFAAEVPRDGETEPGPEPVTRWSTPGSAVRETQYGPASTTLESTLSLDNSRGLSSSVDGADFDVIPWGAGAEQSGNGARPAEPVLHLISSGTKVRDPAALLGTEQMVWLLLEAEAAYDIVLIDSSPLLTVSDAIPLATGVDGVIALTRSNLTTRDDAQRFRRALDRLPDVTVLGLVLNGVRDSHGPRYHDAGYP